MLSITWTCTSTKLAPILKLVNFSNYNIAAKIGERGVRKRCPWIILLHVHVHLESSSSYPVIQYCY